MDYFRDQLMKAKTFRLSGEYSKAIRILEQLQDQFQDDHRFLVIACLNELSQCLWRKGQPPEAILQAQKALELAEKAPPDMVGQGNALSNLGVSHWQLGKLDIAEYYLQRSLKIREEVDDPQTIAHSLNNLGLVYWRLAELDRAEECFKQSLTIKEELGDPRDIAFTFGNLGIISRYQGKLHLAERFYQRSLVLFEESGDLQETASALINLGILSYQRGEIDQAEEYHRSSLAIREKLGNPQDIARSLANLGLVYWQQREVNRAEDCFKRCIALKEKIGDPRDLAESHYQLIRILLAQATWDKASIHINQLAELSKLTNHPVVTAQFQLVDALWKEKQHEFASALLQAEQAKALAEEIPHFELQVDAMLFLVRILLQLYSFSEEEEHLDRTKALLSELEELSKNNHLHGVYVESIFIRGLLSRALFDFKDAIELFRAAELRALELGIQTIAEQAHEELEILQKQIVKLRELQKVTPHAYEQTQLQSVLDYLKRVREFHQTF